MRSHHTAAAEEDDDVECMGESTRAQPQAEAARDAAAREHAVDVDSEDEAVMGGAPVRGVLHAASQLTFADLSEDSDEMSEVCDPRCGARAARQRKMGAV